MMARSTPSRGWATSITGVMQFVVQLAHEMIWDFPSGRFTPCTTVGTVSDFDARGEDHVRRAGLDMPLEVFGGREDPWCLEHQVDAELLPRQLRRVTLGKRRDPSAVDDQRALRGTDLGRG
jgi:hypothetical protein